jgi:hypothetical protein
MFEIFHEGTLIGRSELEGGDPPMGLASGLFAPTDAYSPLRALLTPVINGTGTAVEGFRRLDGLTARAAGGARIDCYQVTVFEMATDGLPILEVHCDFIEPEQYRAIFAHHRKAYDDDMQELAALNGQAGQSAG